MSLFSRGGLNDEGGMIDEVSGNEVPVGGTKEGVRDDIPANVSEGEFIFPEDVTRFIGLDKLMQLRQDAKMGLKKMDAMGQMGNSDEATMDDDMPFGMADLMVVSANDEPMEFADGGFIPVENYTKVQDMISDKAKKGSGVQNFQEGGIVTLDTADVPTIEQVGEIDYDAYMNNVITVVKEYRNAAGESTLITFINGVNTTPIPPGYTLYEPVVGEPVVTTPATGVAAVVNDNNSNNNDNDNNNQVNTTVKPIDYAGMTDAEFAERMEYENTKGYQTQKIIGLAIASMIPFGGILAYGSMRSHARASEARLNSLIESASTPAEKARLSGIRDELLKNSKLKPSEESGALAKWVDGWLIGQGYTAQQAAGAANFVASAEANGLIGDTAEQEANTILQLTDLTKNALLAGGVSPEEVDSITKKSLPPILEFYKSLDTDTGGGSPSTNILATLASANDLTPEEQEAARKNLTGKEFSNFIGGMENLDTKDVLREQVSGLAPTRDKYDPQAKQKGTDNFYTEAGNFVQAPDRNFRDMSQTEAAFGEASVLPAKQERLAIDTPPPAPKTNLVDNQGDTGGNIFDTALDLRDMSQTKDAFTAGQPFSNFANKTNIALASDDSTAAKAAEKAASNYYSTGAGSKGATSRVSYDPQAQQKGTGNQFTNEESGLDRLAKERASQQPISTQQQTQTVFGEDYTPTSAELNKQLAASGQTNLTITPTLYDPQGLQKGATSGFGKEPVQTAVSSQQETFAQAFARNKAAGAKVFTHTDGKKYTTQTVEERKASQAVPTTSNTGFQSAANALTPDDGKQYVNGILVNNDGTRVNSAYQNAANAFTPSDGKEYVGGVLVGKDGKQTNSFYQNTANALTPSDGKKYVNGVLIDEATNKIITQSSSSSGGSKKKDDPYEALNNPEGQDVSTANTVNKTSGVVVKANQEQLNKSFGDPGAGNVWGVEPGTNAITKVRADDSRITSNTTNPGGNKSNDSGSSGSGSSGGSSGTTSTTTRSKEAVQASINKALKDSGGTWTSELNTLVKERDTSTPAPAAPAPKKDKDNGGSSSGGGGDKIVCTAMNNSYGFGSYRQAIWLSYSQKNLTKAHEVGYHTIFRPLVKIAYKKNNKFVRAILENIARHRTADLRAEMQGKDRNTLGYIYRSILEPICYAVGKYKMFKDKQHGRRNIYIWRIL